MKLISHSRQEQEQLALMVDNHVYDINLQPEIFGSMADFLKNWQDGYFHLQQFEQEIKQKGLKGIPFEEANIIAPVPRPASCRDAYAFRQHVETARLNRGARMIPEFDQFPVFYFTNHHAIYGPGEIACMPDHFQELDFELEVAMVINRTGKNIPAAEADQYIGGFMIMNDFSARLLQREEMKLNLGPAKGKDFATAFGPWLATPDELEPFRTPPKAGHTGNAYDLNMCCRVNGIQVSRGNMKDMDWTFAEIIERCSYGVTLSPGDVIGSGTVGTGCFLELNGTGKRNNPGYREQWLQPGDVTEMEVEGLGILKNSLVLENTNYSILQKKKQPTGL